VAMRLEQTICLRISISKRETSAKPHKTNKNNEKLIRTNKKHKKHNVKTKKAKNYNIFGPWSLYLQPIVPKYCFFLFVFVFTLWFLVCYWSQLASIGFLLFSGLGAASQKECAAARSAARVRSPGTLNATAPWLLYLPVLTFPNEKPMQSRKKPIQTMKNQSEPIENQKKHYVKTKKQKKTIFLDHGAYIYSP
jgi:hypothetical protein